ncbi:MAG: 16S rRNA (guanine(527)-N(7))-methyltransferase RsmG [Zoogloeaceae bacterium]|nr:16S rRNA (guanine(527)-N(7))-methyltransferase RsmG [Zoogloeaceae bacterium]
MSLEARLERGLAALGVGVPASVRARLLDYAALLLKWNRTYNLTAIRDPEQIVTHHLLDSLAVLPHLAGVATLADVGSGAGLPGIPLALVRPDLTVTSIETVSKKASFQQQAKIELGLANFTPRGVRVEQFQPDSPFDGVISRAFSDLAEFVRLAGHLAGPDGRLFAMKGLLPAAEIAALPSTWEVARSEVLAVPDLDAERHLIVLKRKN